MRSARGSPSALMFVYNTRPSLPTLTLVETLRITMTRESESLNTNHTRSAVSSSIKLFSQQIKSHLHCVTLGTIATSKRTAASSSIAYECSTVAYSGCSWLDAGLYRTVCEQRVKELRKMGRVTKREQRKKEKKMPRVPLSAKLKHSLYKCESVLPRCSPSRFKASCASLPAHPTKGAHFCTKERLAFQKKRCLWWTNESVNSSEPAGER